MQNITKKQDNNLGGNFNLWFVPINEIDEYPRRTANTLSINAEITTTHGWYVFEFIRQTLLGDEAEKKETNQSYFDHLIDGFINASDEALLLQLEVMSKLRFIVLRRNANGEIKQHGTPKQPLQFSFRHTSKSRHSDLAGIDFKFFGSTTKQSLFYRGAITEHVNA